MLRQLGDKFQLIIYPFIRQRSEGGENAAHMIADPETGDIRFFNMVVNGDRRVDKFLEAVALCRDHIEQFRDSSI